MFDAQVERAKNSRWVDHGLYHAVKEVNSERSKLTDAQRRLVDMYLLEARLNGIDLTGGDRKHFTQLLASLVQAKNQFRNRVALSHNLFSHTVFDPAEVCAEGRNVIESYSDCMVFGDYLFIGIGKFIVESSVIGSIVWHGGANLIDS